ncbi:hypothetical protein Acr_20g0010430 [Actinidia rufa]|uniref:Uncharacterized protein n=1 Tax=Actinidia rufa TaxID=165716 RepID=A0A7J0GEP5_9ERIC|nr:hypothetical protein Acr_20g0010430 [Actinidia rufa]
MRLERPHARHMCTVVPRVVQSALTQCHVSRHVSKKYSGNIPSVPNGKLTTSMVIDVLFNEEARRREIGTTDQSESQALVSEGSRKRGQGQGKGHHRGTEKGRWRSQTRDRTFSKPVTAVTAEDEDEIDFLLAASADGKSNWVLDSGSAYYLCRDREQKEWTREATIAHRHAKQAQGYLEDPEQYKSAWRYFEICAKVWPDTSGATSIGCPERSSKEGDQVDFEELYSNERGDAETGRKDGATTTRKVMYLATHPGGGAGHLDEKVSYLGARPKAVRMDNLKTSDYPPVGWRGRLLSPTHLDESKSNSQAQARLELTWSVHVRL